MTMFSFNRVDARPDASARNPSTAASDRQPFAVRLASDVLVAAGILALFGLIAWILPAIGEPIGPKGVPSQVSTNLADLPYYALRSVFRMFVALFFSLVFTFIYGTAAARCRRLSRMLIPLLDILQSVPILGFFRPPSPSGWCCSPARCWAWRPRRFSQSSPVRPGTWRSRSPGP